MKCQLSPCLTRPCTTWPLHAHFFQPLFPLLPLPSHTGLLTKSLTLASGPLHLLVLCSELSSPTSLPNCHLLSLQVSAQMSPPSSPAHLVAPSPPCSHSPPHRSFIFFPFFEVIYISGWLICLCSLWLPPLECISSRAGILLPHPHPSPQ